MHHSYKGCPHLTDADYLARLKSKLKETPRGCWEIQGFRHKEGYGAMSYRNRQIRAHKLMWMLAVGPIPDGICVLHRCDNPPCCNPAHLWLGTRGDNLRDMAKKGRHQEQQKTHCPRKHPYEGANLGYQPNGARVCKTCTRARHRIKAGWPEHLAYSHPRVPAGYSRSQEPVDHG